jgi:hypothetical protein
MFLLIINLMSVFNEPISRGYLYKPKRPNPLSIPQEWWRISNDIISSGKYENEIGKKREDEKKGKLNLK